MDLLPDLGERFVIDCLNYYGLDPDQVVNAILEDNLPPSLSNIDRAKSSKFDNALSTSKEEKTSRTVNERKIEIPRSKVKINDPSSKLKSMLPLNLFYNKVRNSSRTHNDKRSLYFTDLLHPSLGNLESSLQINFMVEYEWLMMNYEVSRNHHKPLTIIYGEDNNELSANAGQPKPNVIAKRVKPRYPYGTHHTKMMVLAYDDKSVRIVVHTSNLISSDWENRTQGIWVGPRCPVLENSKTESESSHLIGDSNTHFKQCLLRYLNYYEVTVLRPFVEKIKACDFSSVNAFFIGSVPGSHVINPTDPFRNWGHAAVAKILCRHNEPSNEEPEDEDNDIVFQSSSIGSLGNMLEGSFVMELAASFNATTSRSFKKLPKVVRVVYPTKENVFNSYGGPLYGGGCLPYSQRTSEKQPWLPKIMCKWESDSIHRSRAMPHIKSYTKLNGFCAESKAGRQRPRASYFLLTSANISKPAWGSLNKKEDKLFVQSYEAGVLLLPKFTHGSSKYSYSVTAEGPEKPAELVLPYDLPLTEYDANDEPWVGEFLIDIV